MNQIIICLLALIVVLLIIFGYKKYFNNKENFEDNSRIVRMDYPLSILSENGWLRAGKDFNPRLNINTLTKKNDELNLNWATEKFFFENIYPPGALNIRNSTNPIMQNPNNTLFYWKLLDQDGYKSFYLYWNKDKWDITTDRNVVSQNASYFSLEKVNNNDKNTYIQYGDKVRIKLGNNKYLQYSGTNITLIDTPDKTTEFTILDNYGNMLLKDWARESIIFQSSNYNNNEYPPTNAIDGDIKTFSHTSNQSNPLLDVYLPKMIFIDKIVIINRQDCCKERLFPLNINIMAIDYNTKNEEFLLSIPYNETDPNKFNRIEIGNIYKMGNKVRLHLPGDNRYLHISSIQVYGYATDNTIDIINNIEKLILPVPVDIKQYTIERELMPVFNQNMSMLFKLNLNSLVDENKHYTLLQGTDKFTYSFKIYKNQLEFMGYKEKNPNKNYWHYKTTLTPNKDMYVGVVVNRGINELNGWSLIKKDNQHYLIQIGTFNYYTIKNIQNAPEWNRSFISHTMDLNMMNNLGEYNSNLYKPSVSLFFNDKFVKRFEFNKEEAIVIPNHQKLTIYNTSPELNGTIGPIISSNMIYTENQMKKLKRKLFSFNENKLILKSGSLLTNNSIQSNIIPSIHQNATYSFWFKNDLLYNTDEGMKSILQRSGMEEGDLTNSPSIYYNTANNTITLIFDTIDVNQRQLKLELTNNVIKPAQWYYMNVYLIQGKNIEVYLQNKLITNYTLPNNLLYSNSTPLILGQNSKTQGLNGYIENVYIANYNLSVNERKQLYSKHPDKPTFEYVNKTFKNIGCKNNLVPNIDYNYKGENWYKLISKVNNNNANPELIQKLTEIKVLADTFLSDPQSINSTEGINAVNLCYGNNSKMVAEKLYEINKQLMSQQIVQTPVGPQVVEVPIVEVPPVTNITEMTPEPIKEKNKKLMILPQIMYGKDRYLLFSEKYKENKSLNYPQLNKFTIQFMILPNKTDNNSAKQFSNVFTINNSNEKNDIFGVRYNLFTNQLMICMNNQPNNVYTCIKLKQKLNQTIWNSVTIKVTLKQIEVEINKQQKEIIQLNNSLMFAEQYIFEFGKLTNRPNQNKIILNVDGFDGFIKNLVLSNYILSVDDIDKYKNRIYNNENIDVDQLIIGLDYADQFKDICSNKNLGMLCEIKSLMVPHIQNYWNIWKEQVVKNLGYQNRIQNINDPILWQGTYVDVLFNRFDRY